MPLGGFKQAVCLTSFLISFACDDRRSDTDGTMSPVEMEFSREQALTMGVPLEQNSVRVSEERVELELELDAMTKDRTRTQSSHCYEPINLHQTSDGTTADQPAVTVADETP